MGWLKKKFKQVGKKLKKFFKSDVGKAIGTIALAVAGFYTFGPAATATAGQTTATAGQTAATAGATGATAGATGATAGATGGAAAGSATGMFGGTLGPTIRSGISNFFGGTGGTTTGVETVATEAAAGEKVLTAGEIAGAKGLEAGTQETVNQVASNVINNANAQVASGGNNIISPNLTDAVTETINVSGGGDTAALESLQAEYSQRGLTNLADATQADITATGSQTFTSTTAPKSQSLLSPEMPVETFDTSFVDGPSNLGPSSETLAQRTSTAGAPTTPVPDPVPDKSPFFSDATKEYAAQVGVGTTTSLLTGAILGPGDEPEGGGGMLVSYDKAEAPAGSYVADISKTYQQNGGMPLKFDMYQNGTVPMYGPSSPRGLANNPFIYAS
jgi:hypothetical protein